MLSPIRALQSLSFIRFLSLSLPIFAPFILSRGLSNEQVIYAQSVFAISLVLFELPSGYLSDVLCRKTLLVCGTLFLFLAILVFLILESFIGLVISGVLYALATSFFSGTDSAYLFEFLKENNQAGSYPKQESNMQMIARGSEAIGGILSGILAMFALYLPILMWVILLFVGIFIALSLPKLNSQQADKIEKQKKFLVSLKTFLSGSKAKHILMLVCCSAVLSTIILSYFWLSQLYLVKLQLPYYYFGLITCAYLLTAATFSKLYMFFFQCFKNYLILVCAGLAVLGLFIFWSLSGLLSLIGGFFIQAAFGLKMPLVYNLLNQESENNYRAFVISLDSVFSRTFFGIAAIAIGKLSISGNIQHTVLIVLIISVCLLLPFMIGYFFFLSKNH